MTNTDDNSKNNIDDPISVSDFITQVNASLLSHKERIQGEVTSLSLKYPTAIYFTIKDKEQDALLDCIIWRSAYNQNSIDLKVGDEIIVTGTPEVYAPRGRFSLKTQTVEYAGEGNLKKAYEELKEKLSTEKLFDLDRKRALPEFPRKIGVITSKAGVVMQDFISNLGRYGFKIITVDSRVEGKDAIHEILAAMKTIEKQDIEILVIMRGGGSWEVLQAFNTESVVRAIANFKYPVVTGIGHDVDVTLAEMVADVGVSTPTAVAEALNESWDTLLNSLDIYRTKIISSFHRALLNTSRIMSQRVSTIHSEFNKLEKKISRLRTAFQKIVASVQAGIRAKHNYIGDISKRIILETKNYVHYSENKISVQSDYIYSAQDKSIRKMREHIINIEKSIRFVNPERNLKLGYSLLYKDGSLIRSKSQVSVGNTIKTHVSDGVFTSEVKSVE